MDQTGLYFGLAAPLALLLFSLVAFLRSGRRSPVCAVVPLMGAVLLSCAAGLAVCLSQFGADTLAVPGPAGSVLALRLDLISVILFALVAFIGTIVMGYARVYLDGEARQGAFLGWMALTLASVLMLISSGTLWLLVLAWIGTSLFLQRLLMFYADRPGARRAGRKKFVFARISDVALIAAAAALAAVFGTADIATILEMARSGEGLTAGQAGLLTTTAAICLAFAAILKSAQFPFHGWLTEVMETPTPVSALLHAGVINAGGFLLIRFADVMLLSPGTLAGLVMVGGFTACFGGLVMLTQPAVKTSLAWSTIAQMGFMILQCGLALFPLALLHIVAHSLYKAHAFLSSGGAVTWVASLRRPGPVAVPSVRAVGLAFTIAIGLYAAIGLAFGFDGKSPQAIALGAILIFGVAYLVAQGLADKAPRALTAYTSLFSALAATAYFALQTGAEVLLSGTLPVTPVPGPLEWALVVLALMSFGLTAFAQATFPLWSTHPATTGLRVHLANGLYVNALTDRWLGSWSVLPSRSA